MRLDISSFIALGFAILKMRDDAIVNTTILIQESITLEQAKKIVEASVKFGNV
jgi:hypothetical protein